MSLRFQLTYGNLKSWATRLEARLGVPCRYSDEVQQLAVRAWVMDTAVALVLIPRPERGMLTLAVTLPFAVPSERHAAISESLTILNARSFMGAWILNTEKAEIYFRITVPAKDLEYSDETLHFVASLVESSAEAMAKPLYAVAHQGATPELIAQAEA
jgi:hypothetical protein